MSFPTFSVEDTATLEAACEGDQNTLATIEAFCSSKTDGEVCEVVQDRLVHAKGTAVFAAGLARAISRLRSLGVRLDSHKKGRVLRAVGLCVSKALQADLAELRILGLHRGLRQPALLLALAEVVPDNSVGSDAQRAAASSLVAFCDRSPTLWKELAKLIRGDARLLKGFLGQASSLASITDHRTQEIAFEAVYRMWKVWKKQPGGPPALPSATHNEIKEGLSGISTTDFESQVRSMLAAINTSGDCDSDDGGCGRPPSSFPVETVCQVTDWAGLGCEQRLGDVRWLDVGGDSISIQVYPKSSRERDGDVSPGVFVSIPADVVAASGKIMVGTRSMQLDVPFLQCPALIRVAKKPPGSGLGSVSCTLVFRLKGGSKTFNLFRKTIAGLISTVAKDREEDRNSRSVKASLVSSNDVPDHLDRKEQRLSNKQLAPVAPGSNRRGDTKRVRRPDEETPKKAADSKGRLSGKERRVSDTQLTPSATGGTSATGGNRRSATKRVREPKETPKKAGDKQVAHKKSRTVAEPTTSPFELTEENVRPVNSMPAPPPKNNPTPAKPLKKTVCGSAKVTVAPTVRAMFRARGSQAKSTGSIRNIAEGVANALSPSLGPDEEEDVDDEDVDKDSWMEPHDHLDLAPANVGGKKDKSKAPKTNKIKETSRAKQRGKTSGRGLAIPEKKKDWEISDEEEHALSQSPEQLSPAGSKPGKRGEKERGGMPLESGEHRMNAETVKRGYSFGAGRRDDDDEDAVTVPNANRKRPAPGSGSATDEEHPCRYRARIDYAECDSEDPGEEAEEVTTTNDCPDEEACEENSPPWEAGKTDFSNTKADNDEEESESEDDVDGSCDADDGNADDGSGGGGEGCIEEEEDSAMLAQLYNQLVMASQARDKRSKKRKTDARMEEAWEECGTYLERTSQAVVEHWRRQAGELLEEGRQMEEAVGAAKEAVRAMNVQHEAQWNASKERLKKHASVLERLGGHLASGKGASSSGLERQREDEATALQRELQEHRVAAVARFAKTLTNFDNKKPKKAFGGGRGSSLANTSAILSHLKIRTK